MKLLEELQKRHGYSLKRLSAMLGISPKRIAELLSNYEPTKEEKHKIETLKRFACITGHGLNFDDEINHQKKQIAILDQDLKKRLSKVDSSTHQDIINCVEGLKSECMYIGCFYSNNNQEDLIHDYVRQNRKVKGTDGVR